MKEMEPKPPEREDAERLERLLKTVKQYELNTEYPPRKLKLELDGEELGEWTAEDTPKSYRIPHWGETFRLTDEAGTTRAHIYIPDQTPGSEEFDKGRIALDIEQDEMGYLTLRPKVDFRKD